MVAPHGNTPCPTPQLERRTPCTIVAGPRAGPLRIVRGQGSCRLTIGPQRQQAAAADREMWACAAPVPSQPPANGPCQPPVPWSFWIHHGNLNTGPLDRRRRQRGSCVFEVGGWPAARTWGQSGPPENPEAPLHTRIHREAWALVRPTPSVIAPHLVCFSD